MTKEQQRAAVTAFVEAAEALHKAGVEWECVQSDVGFKFCFTDNASGQKIGEYGMVKILFTGQEVSELALSSEYFDFDD